MKLRLFLNNYTGALIESAYYVSRNYNFETIEEFALLIQAHIKEKKENDKLCK